MLATLLFRAHHYLKHRLRCLRQHPGTVAYQFFVQCIKPAGNNPLPYPHVEAFRQMLYCQSENITFTDPKTKQAREVQLSKLARKTASSTRFNQMLPHLCQWLRVNCALETGTSLGLSAYALAQAPTVKKVITLEGAPTIAQKAGNLLQNQKAISVHTGMLREKFPELLLQHQPQLIFLDADHRSSEVLFCLQQIAQHATQVQAVIIHDIYWSRDMYQGWGQIKKLYSQALPIDLYECGVLLWPDISADKPLQAVDFCW